MKREEFQLIFQPPRKKKELKMNKTTVLTRLLVSTFAISMFGVLPATASADPDPEYGPGMMMQGTGAYGPGMMGGYGGGMMGAYGPGMMRGYGHGMMGSHGPGMMGGYGHGMMMGIWSLNLSKEQRAKVNRISDDMRRKHWELMGRMQEQSSSLRNLYEADKWDAKEIGKAYQGIYDLKRQMIESSVETHNRINAILTKEQREELRKSRPWGGMMWQEP